MELFLYKILPHGAIFLLASTALSLLLTRICISVLPALGMVDIPRGRHQHERTVPRGGGLAIILSFVAACVLYYCINPPATLIRNIPLVRQFALPALVITLLGVLDDKFELRSWIKLLVQIGIAFYFYFTGAGINNLVDFQLPMSVGLPLTVCWVVGITNAFNLIDGMDGVAAGLATISGFSLAMWGMISGESATSVIILLIFCGSCLGFLKYNFTPARIFMGDTGSMFLGIFFAYFSMAESAKAATISSLLVPILAMGVPIFDVFLAIIRRFIRKYVKKEEGVGIMTGDHDHLHHRINEKTKDQKKTVYFLYGLALLLVFGAIFASLVSNVLQTLGFAVLMITLFMIIRCATIEFYDTAKLISGGLSVPRKSFLLTALHPLVDMFLVVLAYFITTKIFQRNIMVDPWALEQLMIYIAPYPLFLSLSGIYRTYWLRAGINRYYKLFRVLFLTSVVVLALALGALLLHYGKNRDHISLMREFFSVFMLLSAAFIFLERFLLHYMESYNFRHLARVVAEENRNTLPRALIYGGGLFCRMFLISQNCISVACSPKKIIGLVDDNPALKGLNVYGLDVLGNGEDLEKIHAGSPFDEIIITLTVVPDELKSRIESFAAKNNIKVSYFQCVLQDSPHKILNTEGKNE